MHSERKIRMRAHPDLNQGPADLQSAALTTELCTRMVLPARALATDDACAAPARGSGPKPHTNTHTHRHALPQQSGMPKQRTAQLSRMPSAGPTSRIWFGSSTLCYHKNPATRNRTRDHLIAAAFYSQMLYQLSYSRCVRRSHTKAKERKPKEKIMNAQSALAVALWHACGALRTHLLTSSSR